MSVATGASFTGVTVMLTLTTFESAETVVGFEREAVVAVVIRVRSVGERRGLAREGAVGRLNDHVVRQVVALGVAGAQGNR